MSILIKPLDIFELILKKSNFSEDQIKRSICVILDGVIQPKIKNDLDKLLKKKSFTIEEVEAITFEYMSRMAA